MISCLIPVTLSSRWQAIFCGLLYRSCLKVCLQLWGSGFVSTRRSSNIVWEMYHTVVEHDDPTVSMRCMVFDHWISCAPASDMYLKKQMTQDICCVIFQTYSLIKDQIKSKLFRNLVYLLTALHLEYCKQLEREIHQQYLTLSCVMHRLCNPVLYTIE